MNALPGRAGQQPTPVMPAGQHLPAGSQAADLAAAQTAAQTAAQPDPFAQRSRPVTAPRVMPLNGSSQSHPQHGAPRPESEGKAVPVAVEKPIAPQAQMPTQNGAVAKYINSRKPQGCGAGELSAQQSHAAQGPLRHHAPVTVPVPQAALLASSQHSGAESSQQTASHLPSVPPSILQDLRHAAAQERLPPAQATPQRIHLQASQHALPQLPDSQETISIPSASQSGALPAQRLSTASQPACTPQTAAHCSASLPVETPCPGSHSITADAPLAHQHNPSQAASPAAGDQPLLRSQRLSHKRAANAQRHDRNSVAALADVKLQPDHSTQAAVSNLAPPQPQTGAAQDAAKPSSGAPIGAQAVSSSSEPAVAEAMAEAGQLQAGLATVNSLLGRKNTSALTHNQQMLEASVKQTELELASKVEAANLAVPSVLAECLASNRSKRVPGGDPLEASLTPLPPAALHLLGQAAM